MASVLAAGGVLSHRAAGWLWRLHRSAFLEVTAPRARSRPGIRIHCSHLPGDEVTTHRNIPVTTVPRTLFDLAAVLRPSQLERAMNEAEVQRHSDPLSLPDLLDRYPGRAGTPTIRAMLAAGARLTRSELEARFLAFLDAHGFPPPEANAWLSVRGHWIECDCVWRGQRLVVELDGRAVHDTADAFERDRARDRRLNAAGWRVVRVTWRQLRDEPEVLATDLRAVLSRFSL
jgi:hypothetical protein